MHELSLIQGVFDQVLPLARKHNASKITNITLRIGEMTMVVPEAMEFAFEVLSEDEPLLDGATLDMEFVTPRSVCFDCNTEFEHDRFHMRCPNCGSGSTALVAGRECNVASMDYESPDEDKPAQG